MKVSGEQTRFKASFFLLGGLALIPSRWKSFHLADDHSSVALCMHFNWLMDGATRQTSSDRNLNFFQAKCTLSGDTSSYAFDSEWKWNLLRDPALNHRTHLVPLVFVPVKALSAERHKFSSR